MENQQSQNQSPKSEVVWKKAIVPFRDLKIGSDVEGVFIEVKKVGIRIDEKTREEKDRLMAFFHEFGNEEEKFQINATAGLINAIGEAGLKKGDHVKVFRIGKVEMEGKGGKTVNKYDILIAG